MRQGQSRRDYIRQHLRHRPSSIGKGPRPASLDLARRPLVELGSVLAATRGAGRRAASAAVPNNPTTASLLLKLEGISRQAMRPDAAVGCPLPAPLKRLLFAAGSLLAHPRRAPSSRFLENWRGLDSYGARRGRGGSKAAFAGPSAALTFAVPHCGCSVTRRSRRTTFRRQVSPARDRRRRRRVVPRSRPLHRHRWRAYIRKPPISSPTEDFLSSIFLRQRCSLR